MSLLRSRRNEECSTFNIVYEMNLPDCLFVLIFSDIGYRECFSKNLVTVNKVFHKRFTGLEYLWTACSKPSQFLQTKHEFVVILKDKKLEI